MTYLDHAAATPVSPAALKTMLPYFTEEFFNPSAPYLPAKQVREAYARAKDDIAHAIGAKGVDLVMTAGATESINLAFTARQAKALVLATEHAAVLAAARLGNYELVQVDRFGVISLDDLWRKLTDEIDFISISLVNNEIGTIQPFAELAELVRQVRQDRWRRGVDRPLYLHSDASQAASLIEINVARMGVDLLTLNAAKCGGPKGVGALYVGHGINLQPISVGGGQERGLRSGTENVPGVIGFARAITDAKAHLSGHRQSYQKMAQVLRQAIKNLPENHSDTPIVAHEDRKVNSEIQEKSLDCNHERDERGDEQDKKLTLDLSTLTIPEPIFLGHPKHQLVSFVPVCFPGLDAERLIYKLEAVGILVSTGAACAASKGQKSHVLAALGLSDAEIAGSLRISLGSTNNLEQIIAAAPQIVKVVRDEYIRISEKNNRVESDSRETTMNKKVFLGMSGGVDSSVSAILLREQGYDVTGIYMKNWSKDLPGMKCPWAEDLADAKRVAVQLDLDFEVWDFETEYKKRVVDYMLSEFQRGRTPNPDVMCNEEIKFKLFYERAMRAGADYIATGHYARTGKLDQGKRWGSDMVGLGQVNDPTLSKDSIEPSEENKRKADPLEQSNSKDSSEQVQRCSDKRSLNGGRMELAEACLSEGKGSSDHTQRCANKQSLSSGHMEATEACLLGGRHSRAGEAESSETYLLRSRDENKDQTYFLYRMSDAATARTLFPVGGLTKPEVKALAAGRGLDVATKKESMGVCFVGEVGMKDFLREYLDPRPGEFRELETDKILGYHDGAIFYTIGQRHGLYLGDGLPYYVVKKDLAQNIVYVSHNLNNEQLWAQELLLEAVHLRNGLRIEDLAKMTDLKVRLRHRAPLIPVQARGRNDKESDRGFLPITFTQPVKRPAAGQSAVFYSGEICLGGGIIAED